MFLSQSLKQKINHSSVISFDIFDTLLIRPYVHPTDVFLHMEKVFHKPLFFEERVKAEKNARLNHSDLEDVTYDMIYDEISEDYKEMKQKELAWEKMILRQNPEMKQVYDYAKQAGKKIVIASDMYLPTNFLANILQKNDYDGYQKIYVSGDINARKGNGSMYTLILHDMHIKPEQLLHIGDNKRSDYKEPLKMHIKTERYKKIHNRFLNSNKRYSSLRKELKNSLGLSILLQIMAYGWIKRKYPIKQDYWQKLGYQYAGPVGYAYTRFVEQTAKENNIEALLFVARDGYLLEKIFTKLSPNIAHSYVYAPRLLNHICRLDYRKDTPQQAQYIIDFYTKEHPSLVQNISDPYAFIDEHKKHFETLATAQMNNYKKQIKQKIPQVKNYALVDTITGQFSSQKLLESALSQEILGIYWGICEKEHINRYNYKSFVGVHTNQDTEPFGNYFTNNWNFMEFLMTSPEHPIINLDKDGSPIYTTENNKYEMYRSTVYPHIVTGALDFTQDIKTWFNGNDIYLSAKDIVSWVNSYIEYPQNQDIKQMNKIKISENSTHQIWTPLFSAKIGLFDFIKSPQRSIKTIKKIIWRTPKQSLLLCIAKPLSIRIRGLKLITFKLFPMLRKQYLSLSIKICDKISFQLIIGN